MKYITAKDAKNQFGQLLDMARVEPVLVSKHGRPAAVVIAFEEYERLEELERTYWAARADSADREGYLGRRESESLLKDQLQARD